MDGTEAEVAQEAKKSDSIQKKNIDFGKIVKENIKRSEERMQKRWIQKQKKNTEYEKRLKD